MNRERMALIGLALVIFLVVVASVVVSTRLRQAHDFSGECSKSGTRNQPYR